MLQVGQQDRMPVQLPDRKLQVAGGISFPFLSGRPDSGKETYEKIQSLRTVRDRKNSTFRDHRFNKVRFILFLSSKHRVFFCGKQFATQTLPRSSLYRSDPIQRHKADKPARESAG